MAKKRTTRKDENTATDEFSKSDEGEELNGDFEFEDDLETRSTIRLLPYGLASAQAVDKIGADAYEGPGLAIESVAVEGPLHDGWPPPSHRAIFGDLPQVKTSLPNQSDRVEVASEEPLKDAERIRRSFARRAFRHRLV